MSSKTFTYAMNENLLLIITVTGISNNKRQCRQGDQHPKRSYFVQPFSWFHGKPGPTNGAANRCQVGYDTIELRPNIANNHH